jgi:poly-beta-1,6-N-acetyl-D-glucosamine biosynthesis protein PgaD
MTPPKPPRSNGKSQTQTVYQAPPDHIIDTRAKVPLIVRIRDLILTILLWAMYIYFMKDFFLFCADLFHWAMGGFNNTADYSSFAIFDSLKIYLVIIAFMTVFFIGWAMYNLLRFRNKTRRRHPMPVSPEEIAQLYGFPVEKVETWQQAETLVMHHDKEGLLTNVVIQ